jgi:hypothetical protein
LQALRASELLQGLVEAPLAKAQHAAGVVEHELSSPVGGCLQTRLRAIEIALGIVEAPQPDVRHPGHRERASRHRRARPAVLFGNRERPLAQLERHRQRLPGQRRQHRKVRETPDLDERS